MKLQLLTIGLLAWGWLWAGHLWAQALQMGPAQRTIEGQVVPGWATALPLDRRRTEKAWAQRLRRWGKVKSSKSTYTIESALIPAVSLNPVRVVSRTEKMVGGVVVFLAVAVANDYLTAQDEQADAVVTFLEDFSRQAFRDEKARDVANAEKHLQQTERAYAQLRKEQTRLEARLTRNAEAHQRLTQLLATRQTETASLVAVADSQRRAFEVRVADTLLSKREEARLREPLASAEKSVAQNRASIARTEQKILENEGQRRRLDTALAENARRQQAAQQSIATARTQLEKERAHLAEMGQ